MASEFCKICLYFHANKQDIMTAMNQMFFIPYHQIALAFHRSF